MKKISGVYIVKNEDQFLGYSIMSVYDYLSEILIVDNGSSDNTIALVNSIKEKYDKEDKIKVLWYPPEEMLDMGKIRTWAINSISKDADWFMVIDGDEVYTDEAMKKVVARIEDAPDDIVSFRVTYHQVCLNGEYKEADFQHFPDKFFKVGYGWHFDGLLPVDMMKIGEGHYKYRPFVSYDNPEDTSQESPIQPILKDVFFYHYARSKTFKREHDKWAVYCKNIHFRDTGITVSDEVAKSKALNIKWVNNTYPYEPLGSKPEVFSKYDFSGFFSYKPLVSIIITNYNYTDWMREAIESAIAQTYKNIEIIVVDDGSPDPSIRVTKDYPQVKLITKQNSGPADSLNKGVLASSGDYYISLDADDKLAPDFVERAIKEAKKNPEKMVFYGDLQTFGEQTDLWSYGHYSIHDVIEIDKHTDPVPQSAMIDRRAFNVVGGYDIKPQFFYDWCIFACIYKKLGAGVFHYMPGIHYYYRRHGISNITKLELKRAENEEYLKNKLKTL